MANRTYSVNFKSEGLQALVKDLRSTANLFDSVLADSKTAVDKVLASRRYLADTGKIASTEIAKVATSETTQLLAQTKQQFVAWSEAITTQLQSGFRKGYSGIRSSSPKVVAFKNDESIIPRVVVFNSPFQKPEPPPDPLAKLQERDRILVEVWRSEYQQFFTEFREELKEGLKDSGGGGDNGLSLVGRIISTPFQLIGDAIKFPIEAALLGAFSGFGESLSADFNKGFAQKLQKGMGLSLETVGVDLGGVVGQSVYRSYEASLKAVRKMILSQSPDKMPEVGELIEDLKKILLGTLVQSAVVPLKAHKRIQINKKALPQVMSEAGNLLINRQLDSQEAENIEKQKSITLLVGGVNGDETAGNTEYVHRLLKPLLGESHVVPVKNFWSNSKISEEFKDFAIALIKNIFSHEHLASGAIGFLKNQGFEKSLNFEQFKGLSIKEQDKFAKQLIDFFESGQLPFGRLLESAYHGFNSDDIMVAAQAAYYKQHFPDKPINIVGTSGGGFNASGAIEMLNNLGYQDIKGVGITTPFTGLEHTGNPKDFYASMGTRDPYYQMLFGSVLKGFIEPPDLMQVVPGAGMGHLLASYVGTPEFQNFFQYFFKDRIKVPKGMDGGVMNYISRRVQSPEDENIQRTLLSLFGQQTTPGYTFSADDLAGLTQELGKKANKIKDKDIKKEAQIFVDFLDTLSEELKIISVVGGELKPYKSLQKAAEIYPELTKLAAQNQPSAQNEALRSAIKGQLEANKIFISFKSKVKSEADNIKRTLQALRGQQVEGYAFYHPEEYEARANDHLGGLIGHLENNLLKGATPKQKAKASKYIDYLKQLQQAILARGKDGIITPELESEGQKLFGFSLEGTAPIPTKEQRRAKIPKSPKQIAAEYNNYLASLREAMSVDFGDVSNDLPQVIKAVKQQLKEYRLALASSQLEIAKNLGENLLEIIGAVKSSASSSGKVSPQTLGTLSRYQNEILKGDKGKGRAQVGLIQLAESNADFQALIAQSKNAGNNVTKGLTTGVDQNLASAKESGKELGLAVIKGAEGELEIKSPSRRFVRIGKFIVEGLRQGVEGITNVFATDVAHSIHTGVNESLKAAQQSLEQTIDVTATTISVEPDPTKETPLQRAQRLLREARWQADLWDEPVPPQISTADTNSKSSAQKQQPLLKASYDKLPDPWDTPLTPTIHSQTDTEKFVPQYFLGQYSLPPTRSDFWTIPDFWDEQDSSHTTSKNVDQHLRNRDTALPSKPPLLPSVSNSSLNQLFTSAGKQALATIKSAQLQARTLILEAIKSVEVLAQQARSVASELSVFSEAEAAVLIKEIQSASNEIMQKASSEAAELVDTAIKQSQQAIAELASNLQLAPSQLSEFQKLQQLLAESAAAEWNPLNAVPKLPQAKERRKNHNSSGKSRNTDYAGIPDPWETEEQARVLITPPPKQATPQGQASRGTNGTTTQKQKTGSDELPRIEVVTSVENLEELQSAAHRAGESIQTEVTDATVKAKKWFDKIFNRSGINKTVDEGLGSAISSVGKFFGELEQQFPILGRLKSVIADLAVNLLAMFGVFSASIALVQIGQSALETARKFEELDRVIVSASGNAAKGAANLKFVGEEAKRLSLDLEAAKSAYGQLLASAQGSALEGEPVNQIFSAVGEAAVAKGLNKEGQSSAFLAIEQMISKGKISAQELRLQLSQALPGTLQTAARALGVTTQQLDKMLDSGQLLATDFLPKFAAQLSAENASGVAGSANSATSSITRFNNALTEFQQALGEGLQPAQKLGLNGLSTILEGIRTQAELLVKVLVALILLVGVRLVDAFRQSIAAGKLAELGITSLKDAFIKALPAIKQFLAEMILLSTAIQTWTNVYQLSQDSFKDITEYANSSAKGLDNLAEAYRNASGAADDFNSKPKPKRDRDLISNGGIDFFGVKLNLDTMYRKPIDWIAEKFGGHFATQGEREYNDFLANAGDLITRVYQNNTESGNAKNIIAQIQAFDRELEKVRSKRFDLLPGDREGLQKSIEQEQTLLQEREKLLKITSTIQSNFARDAENIKKTLQAIDRLPKGADTDSIRASLEAALNDTKKSQTVFDGLISSVSRGISEMDRRMRDLNEGMAAFGEVLELKGQAERANVINSGVATGRDPAKVQFDVQGIDRANLQLKIARLTNKIAQIERDLRSPAMSGTVQNLGIDPVTVSSVQLDRMLQEGRSPSEQSALKAIKDLKGYRTQLYAANEQLATNGQQIQSTLREFTLQLIDFYTQLRRQIEDLGVETNKTIQELQQQFNATNLEIESLAQSILLTNFKATLTQPLLTQAQRLLNGTNDAFEQYIQGLMGGLEKIFQRANLNTQLKQQIEQINNQIRSLTTAQSDRVRALQRQQEDKQKEYRQLQRSSPLEFGAKNLSQPSQQITRDTNKQTKNTVDLNFKAEPPLESFGGDPAGNNSSLTDASTPQDNSTPHNTNTERKTRGRGNLAPTSSSTNLNQAVESGVAKLPEWANYAKESTEQATQQNILALEQKKKGLIAQFKEQIELNKRETTTSFQQTENNWNKYIDATTVSLQGLNDQLSDLDDKYKSDTPEKQYDASVRSINAENRSLNLNLKNQIKTLEEQKKRAEETIFIITEQDIPKAHKYQQQLLADGNSEEAESYSDSIVELQRQADFLSSQLPQLEILINQYKAQKKKLPEIFASGKQYEEFKYGINSAVRDREIERTLNESGFSVVDASANLLQSQGDEFGSKRVAKEKAVASENERYTQQIFDIDKDAAENPTKYTADQIAYLKENAEDLNRINLANINEQFKDLGQTITETSKGALTQFFNDIFTNTKSVGEAFRDMALTILRSIAQIAAQQVVLNIFGKATGKDDGFLGLFNKILGHADGGLVTGEGTGTSDSIVRRLSNGEFVVRAAAVKHWGTDFLHDLNSMRSDSLAFAASSIGNNGNSTRSVSNPTIVMNVTTSDANSFRRSESQLGRDAGEMYRRSIARNG